MEALKERYDITKLIQTIAEEQGFKNHVITDVKTNKKGEGYLGDFFTVSIKDSNSNQQLHLAIKSAYSEDKVRRIVPVRWSYENENHFYSEIYSELKKFGKERGVSQTFDFAPKCFKVSMEEKSEMLVLENLRILGFEMHDRLKSLDDDHHSLIFRTYGRFHAYSFALRDQQPESYKHLEEKCYNVYMEFINGFFKNFLKFCTKLAQDSLIPGEDDVIIRKMQEYGDDDLVDRLQDILTENCECSAILHGDCHSNNMMFKYEETQNGSRKPIDIRLIDWQMIKSGSPVCDLSYSIYSGGSKGVLDNLDHYLQVYYSSFSNCVRELGSDPEKLFPFRTLKEHWKKYAIFGMLMALAVTKAKLTYQEDVVDFTDHENSEQFASAIQNVEFDEEKFKKHVRLLLRHVVEVEVL